jgi:hypothetical protein
MSQVEALRQQVYLRSVSQIGRLVQDMSTFSDTCLDGHAMPAVALAGRLNQRLQSSGAPRARGDKPAKVRCSSCRPSTTSDWPRHNRRGLTREAPPQKTFSQLRAAPTGKAYHASLPDECRVEDTSWPMERNGEQRMQNTANGE